MDKSMKDYSHLRGDEVGGTSADPKKSPTQEEESDCCQSPTCEEVLNSMETIEPITNSPDTHRETPEAMGIQEETECCEKCKDVEMVFGRSLREGGGYPRVICKNKDCPNCHKPRTEAPKGKWEGDFVPCSPITSEEKERDIADSGLEP